MLKESPDLAAEGSALRLHPHEITEIGRHEQSATFGPKLLPLGDEVSRSYLPRLARDGLLDRYEAVRAFNKVTAGEPRLPIVRSVLETQVAADTVLMRRDPVFGVERSHAWRRRWEELRIRHYKLVAAIAEGNREP